MADHEAGRSAASRLSRCAQAEAGHCNLIEPRAHRRHLRHVGIYERFDAIVTRDDVTRGKPDPEPYLRAAAAIGIDPAYCLAVEDSHNGARAAHAAGIRVIVVPDLMAPNEEIIGKAHAIMDDLHEVRDFIERADSAA
ncbi:HAD family hydrolase [Asaia platycodi]|uniref:HAD family hydrolase n=1 Tax=Asaia platycodi TaxID=610243 RepID=UPI001F564BFE|nr:HAD-IA family hydrolase [Asaia platycodi]